MIKSIQGIRLLGIITIVAGHAGTTLWGGGDWCSFFFILSGFLYKSEVITWCDYKNYITRKAKAIYPVYWVCLVLYLILAYIRRCPEQYSIGWDILPHLALIQSWVPSFHPMAYLGPGWFLSSLMCCYFVSPILKTILSKTSSSIIAIIALSILWTHVFCWDSYISPVFRLFEYGFGMWLKLFVCNRDKKVEPFPFFNLSVLLCFLLALHFKIVPSWLEIIAFGIIITITYCFSSSSMDLLLGNRYIVNLSKADIFIYLTHPGIAFHLVFYCFGHNIVLVIFGSLILGYCLYIVYHFVFDKVLNYD